MEFGFRLALELWNDALGQYLAQFNAPLVERVKVPDGALGENRVLIERDQLAERFRREFFGKDHVRRAIAPEDAMGRQPCRRTLGFDLLAGLAKRERFSLGKDVGQKYVVMPAYRVESSGESNEVTRD